ncbi:anthocyanidin 3-O-glucosyltransferase 6 [Daucus carota subsp. sativus]
MTRAEVIFIPAPGVGHLGSTVEVSKLLVSRDDRISITIMIMNPSSDSTIVAFTQNLKKEALDRIAFVDIPAPDETTMAGLMSKGHLNFLMSFIECQKVQVRDMVASIMSRSQSFKLAGFVIDMFCTPMIDVANEFNVPSYVFFTSAAASLGVMLYIQSLKDNENLEINDLDVELSIPSFSKPVPAKVLPSVMLSKDGSDMIASIARRLRETKAIVVNTVLELEAHSVKSLGDDENTPAIYHVGPIIKLTDGESTSRETIKGWLDSQPPSSVVFLCFGSMGSFDPEQVTEIACALELSGQRFLWSLRSPSQEKETMALPKDYENYNGVLPEGFLERTAEIGKVIGWAPQVTVLSHPSVGGFVSHCGWNSTLESIWFGVPMAAWPLYAEQQLNAFKLVKELGFAVEIKMDYKKNDVGPTVLVKAEEIVRGIRCLMDEECEMRKKVKEMKDICRKAIAEGGSSYNSAGQFIEDLIDNIPEIEFSQRQNMECGKVSCSNRKVKKKQVKDELDRIRQAEKKKRRLEKALATSAAIRSELEKKLLKKKEEQKRLDEEGAAIAEAVALHVLLGEDSDDSCKIMLKKNEEFKPLDSAGKFDFFGGGNRRGLPHEELRIRSVEGADRFSNVCRSGCTLNGYNNNGWTVPTEPFIRDDNMTYIDKQGWEVKDISAGVIAAQAVSSLKITEDSRADNFLFNQMLRG